MPALYLTEPHSTVRLSSESLQITRDLRDPERREILHSIELHRVDSLVLFGCIHITADALQACIERSIQISLLDRNGAFRASVVPALRPDPEPRIAQYAAALDPARCLALASLFVQSKIHNMALVLDGIQGNYPALPLRLHRQGIRSLGQRAAAASNRDHLMGLEGAATRAYYAGLRHSFRGAISFQKRLRQPPPDPANALISFASVLLVRRLAGVLEALGLDPAIGFLHAPKAGRASLACDLAEEFRAPLVERLVLRVCNTGILQPIHFEPDAARGGLRMTRPGLQLFIREWEKALDSPLRAGSAAPVLTAAERIVQQCESLRRALVDAPAAYRPFMLYGGTPELPPAEPPCLPPTPPAS